MIFGVAECASRTGQLAAQLAHGSLPGKGIAWLSEPVVVRTELVFARFAEQIVELDPGCSLFAFSCVFLLEPMCSKINTTLMTNLAQHK